MNKEEKYISGLGKKSVVPPEIKKWSWGAFFLNWIWGIGNSTYISLLMFVPFINIIMLFVLGAKGNEWAWKNRTWRDVDHFKKTQKKWSIAGFILAFIGLLLFISITSMLKGDAYIQSLAAIESNEKVNEILGSPIEASIFVSGNVKSSGSSGETYLEYSISGPNGSADVYVTGNKHSNKWMLKKVVVYSEETQQKILVVPSGE